MSALDKVLAAAAQPAPAALPQQVDPDVFALAAGEDRSGDDLGDEDQSDWNEDDWEDVRSHLEQESPWAKRVIAGESPGDPDEIPEGWADRGKELAGGELSRLLSLTPRTAEASTVPQPTVPPGGPGLFHIKGRELPPYVQHLYKHLVKKYGKHRAYGVAIGIVKKWASGVNPGGKGKGHKVHADVQAAAAKNVAQWEKDKADAHAHSAGKHVKASAGEVELAVVHAYDRDIQGRMERVNAYIKDNRFKIGVIGQEAPLAKTELTGLYRTSKEDEATFRGHLREARGHYAAGRHEQAIAAIGRAQDVAKGHALHFVSDALERQKEAILKQQRQIAEKRAAASAAPPPKHGGFLSKFRNVVSATQVELAGGEVKGYERRSPSGKLEVVTNYQRALKDLRPIQRYSKSIVFDFDGTMTDDRNGQYHPRQIDVRGIRMAHKRGYNVAVVSAWPRQGIVDKLREQGFNARMEDQPRREFWDGGADGKEIIVTGNKVAAAGYIDDKAINHQPGDDWTHTLNQVDRLRAGFIPEPHPDPDRRRYGADKMGVNRLDDSVDLSHQQPGVLVYLAAPASWPSGRPYKESFLPPGPTTSLLQGQPTRPGVITNGPGTAPGMRGQLRQAPSQTVSAGPPLPTGVTLPTAGEIETLAAQVPDGADITLTNSVRTHLRTAAGKIRKDDRFGALAALRAAQASTRAAFQATRNANMPNTAATYTITAVPPAAASSATTAMLAGRSVTEKYRVLDHQIATHIDRFRREYFGGHVNQVPDARLTGITGVEVLALAQVKGYERETRFGRIVNVHNYMREGKPYSGKLMGDEADEAIKAGVAKGEYGEPTGFFQTSDGKKMWGWYGAAGLLVRHTDPQTGEKRYLLQKRASWVEEPNTYSIPGGAMDRINGRPETPEESAHREAREELGRELPEGTKMAEVRSKTFGEGKGAWSYHTVVMDTPHQFDPEGEGQEGVHDTRNESRGYVWATPEDMANLPLHPHFRATAEELGMPHGGGTSAPKLSAGEIAEGLVRLATGRR